MSKESQKNETRHPFVRLQAELEQLIQKTSPGERLPSEPQLARMMGVSRATLREGMRTFEAQGLIRRRQGVGTFVVPQVRVIETGLEVLESIERLANRIGLAVTMGELEIKETLAGPEIAEKHEIRPRHSGTPPISHISRPSVKPNDRLMIPGFQLRHELQGLFDPLLPGTVSRWEKDIVQEKDKQVKVDAADECHDLEGVGGGVDPQPQVPVA